MTKLWRKTQSLLGLVVHGGKEAMDERCGWWMNGVDERGGGFAKETRSKHQIVSQQPSI
jgi:hypothetical protein